MLAAIAADGTDMATEHDVHALVEQLTARIDRLLANCTRLREENRVLRASQEAWTTERANLLAKNEQARARVEAMIARLRQLETH